jgi:phage repressor protein C with HTH and peptisase S24 domain
MNNHNYIMDGGQSIGDRMRILMMRHGMKQAMLAGRLNVSQSAISQVLSGKNQPSAEMLTALSREFNVNCNWLMLGEGGMYKEESAGGGTPKVVTVNPDGRPNIVLVPVKAQAGYALERLSPEYLRELPAFNLPFTQLKRGEYRAFEIDGDSMEPTLVQNDVVVCSPVENPRHVRDRQLYVFVLEGDVLVKRVLKDRSRPEVLILQSDNDFYPPYEYGLEEIKEIWKVEARVTFDLPAPTPKNPRM